MGLVRILIPSIGILLAGVDGANLNGSSIVDNTTIAQGLWDLDQPFGVHLYGIYKKSMAYRSLTNQLPAIMKKIIESLDHDSPEITRKYGPESVEDLKLIKRFIETLKTEIQTNQPLTLLPLANNEADRDASMWNDHLKLRKEIEGDNLRWLFTRYILAEPYAHRRINHAIALTKTMKNFDPYEQMKQKGFNNSIRSLSLLAKYTILSLNVTKNRTTSADLKRQLITFLKLTLWGNRFDLSASRGEDVNLTGDPIDLLNTFESDFLIDDSQAVWNLMNNSKRNDGPIVVDIVMDNAGYELFADLCLAAFLVYHGFADKVRFHAKQMPWYVSDTTMNDFHWIIDNMRESEDSNLKAFGNLCAENLKSGKWSIEHDPFWTTWHTFGEMKNQAPALYEKLAEATLVIVKGDLNYRKVVGDVNWDHETTLDTVLMHQKFRPSNVLLVRTLKSQICVGLDIDKIRLWKSDVELMGRGKYGIINAGFNAPCVCGGDP